MQTFYGLKSYLVLREAGCSSYKQRRAVIIPYGKVTCTLGKYGTSVRVSPPSSKFRFEFQLEYFYYYLYGIDTLLGSLVPHKTPRSKWRSMWGSGEAQLYKTYLHAVTSSSLPDPLTGLTGTQQALEDLRSADLYNSMSPKLAVYSKILVYIFCLTPMRRYSSMVKDVNGNPQFPICINWNPNLPSFSQPAEFYFRAKSLMCHLQAFRMGPKFNSEDSDYRDYTNRFRFHKKSSKHLQQRAAIMETVASKYGEKQHSHQEGPYEFKYHYNSRDSQLEERVYRISRLTNQWTTNLETTSNLRDILQKWEPLNSSSGTGKTIRYQYTLHQVSLAEYWCLLYGFCRNCSPESDKFRLLFVLSAFAYSGEARFPMEALETILAFATNPRLCSAFELPPTIDTSEGWIQHTEVVQTVLDRIRTTISDRTRSALVPVIMSKPYRNVRGNVREPPGTVKLVRRLQDLLHDSDDSAPTAQHEGTTSRE